MAYIAIHRLLKNAIVVFSCQRLVTRSWDLVAVYAQQLYFEHSDEQLRGDYRPLLRHIKQDCWHRRAVEVYHPVRMDTVGGIKRCLSASNSRWYNS